MNPVLKAVLSHYISERDKSIAELDICLNKSTQGSEKSAVDNAIYLFSKLDSSNRIIETINSIIQDNSQESNIKNVEHLLKAFDNDYNKKKQEILQEDINKNDNIS